LDCSGQKDENIATHVCNIERKWRRALFFFNIDANAGFSKPYKYPSVIIHVLRIVAFSIEQYS